jgi:hypothetical protein
LQGICTDKAHSIFWSFTTVLVKTDADGKRIKTITVPSHHGDLCYWKGKIYVAVNLGRFNEAQRLADSWIYVYDEDLRLLAKTRTPEVVYGAGGIACDGKRFVVVGGLPPGVQENSVYEYDEELHFVKRHAIMSGYTWKGIQTAAYADGCWWFGCYGEPRTLLKVDEAFSGVKQYKFDGSLGIVGLSGEQFLIGRGSRLPQTMFGGQVYVAGPDAINGLAEIRENP